MEVEKLPYFSPNQPITQQVTARRLNQLVEAIRSCTIRPGVGYLYSRNSGGTSLTIKTGKGGGVSDEFPLQVYDATTVSGSPRVSVRFGMLNGLTPTFGGHPLTYTSGTPPVHVSRSITASGYIVMAVNTNVDGVATSAVIDWAATVPDNTTTRGHIALAYVEFVAAVGLVPAYIIIGTSVSGSQWHHQCGGTTHLFGLV